MRRTWIYRNGVAYEKGLQPTSDAPLVMGDIQPYMSMIDGREITSRSQHREHLKAHGCVEVGNEAAKQMDYHNRIPDVAPQQRHELIRAQVNEMTDRQFKAAIKRDIDRVKWHSRED